MPKILSWRALGTPQLWGPQAMGAPEPWGLLAFGGPQALGAPRLSLVSVVGNLPLVGGPQNDIRPSLGPNRGVHFFN
jgi:hypothetical protein